jgi:CCR4-NOT transcription complex subunit 1
MSVNEFIGKLKSFKGSGNPRERVISNIEFDYVIKYLNYKELLMCVVKNLFDEYRFFREYPERELRTTAEVYGGILREGIVAYVIISYSCS